MKTQELIETLYGRDRTTALVVQNRKDDLSVDIFTATLTVKRSQDDLLNSTISAEYRYSESEVFAKSFSNSTEGFIEACEWLDDMRIRHAFRLLGEDLSKKFVKALNETSCLDDLREIK